MRIRREIGVADRFLSHRDQKFRLNYILGAWRDGQGRKASSDDMSFEESPDLQVVDDENTPSDAERIANREAIGAYLDRIGGLTKSVVAKLAGDLGVDIRLPGPDRDTAQQLIEENFDAYLDAGGGVP